MAEREWYAGCVGCIDFGINNRSCDYLLNNGHCRPCPADAKGCAVYSATLRPEGMTEDESRTWNTEEARRLLAKGKSTEEAAAQLGASVNSIHAWIIRGMPAGRKNRRGKASTARGVWDEQVYLKLYEEGLTDPEAAQRMGLAHMTVWKYRKRLGLPANGRKNGVTI